MEYNYDDDSEVPDLNDFKNELIEDIFLSVFFQQNNTKTYNMLKLPIIVPPILLRKQINNEHTKKTLMEKEFSYTDETLDIFMSLVESKEIRVNSIHDMKAPQLKQLSEKLGISDPKKSSELLKTDLTNLAKIFIGGQVMSKPQPEFKLKKTTQ